MSRFFESIEEERSEHKRSIVEKDLLESKEKQPRKEKKLNDLRCRVMELNEEENEKRFDKELKKLFVEIRKAEHVFEDTMPPFLTKFLKSERAYTRTHRRTIDELLSKYEKEGAAEAPEEEKKQKAEDVADSFERILEIGDAEKRRSELLLLKDRTEDPFLKAKSLLVLLSMYVISNDVEHVLAVLEETGLLLRDGAEQMRKDFRENLDFYLTRVYNNLSPSNYRKYEEVLDKLRYLNGDLIERRMLEFKYFKLGQAVETEDPRFKLLYYARSGEYSKAKDYYEGASFGEDSLDPAIRREFGMAAFRAMDFELAFKLLSRCSGEELGLETKILCVILNDRIKKSETFRRFLEGFRDLEANKLCLASANPTLEVYRSFYLLCMLDVEESASIIRKFVPGFDGKPWLSDFVESRLAK
jgi:hypothetical protein